MNLEDCFEKSLLRKTDPSDAKAKRSLGQARVWGGKEDWVDLVTKGSFSVALTKEARKTAAVKLSYKGPLLAPVRAGDQVGTVKVFIEGRAIAELPVMTSESVEAVDSMWQKALDSAMIMAFGG